VNGWTNTFLGVIAVATLLSAVIQIGVLVAAGRLALRMFRLADRVERELKPVFGHLDSIGRDAARAASLAAAQVERADGLVAEVIQRVEHTMDVVQTAVATPAREGAAILAGFRAAISALRDGPSGRPRSRGEDEDALFI
jgi:plasmid replication initiation protein